MRRREFIAGLGSAAGAYVAVPRVARAQQDTRVRRLAVLMIMRENWATWLRIYLRDALKSLGWRNLQLDVRVSSDGKAIDAYADELVRLAPEVILTSSYLATRAVQQRTRSIPIVFAGVGDPTQGGLVKNLARPEGNITGATNLLWRSPGSAGVAVKV
jgi:putative tryptophan/tyrosine transport system substrate-binding protein